MSLISQPDPSDLGKESHQGGTINDDVHNTDDYFATNSSDTLADVHANIFSDTVSMTGESRDGLEAIKPEKRPAETIDPFIYVDEETRMLCNLSPDVNSPRDIVSPADRGGELSSPFSAMESDGMETGFDDASLSAPGDAVRRPTGFFGASTPLEYTTTPGASSSACDDNYESSGSRKKRRKTRRDMHANPAHSGLRLNGPLRMPKPNPQAGEIWHHDPDTSPFSPPTCPKNMNFNFGESSSRRSSGGAAPVSAFKTEYIVENAKRTKTCDNGNMENDIGINNNIKSEVMLNNNDTPVTSNANGTRRRHTHHRAAGTVAADGEPILQRQFPRKAEQFELKILIQPESQHRARYLTEGSRGPVKDATQQGYPKVQLIGYKGPAMPILQVFVANDSGKVKPHGFYQACRVTGRNTSPCEEREIDGTQVIEIPFKQDENMTLSIDCVGILKLRNTDVEVRTGVRNQKRNQSARLAFRVTLKNVLPNAPDSAVVLQCASKCISCTQPLGQPEITKKSIDRCSVEGGVEMFIIGKNFHRGTKVIYQDPEEPNGTQWSAEGELDKDTFHQSHMVVRVPPYHDQKILKPVNVQLLVEFQDKKCEPHIFTYTPRKISEPQKEEEKKSSTENTSSVESALNMSLLDGPIDRKFLAALFSKLLAGGITSQSDMQGSESVQEMPKTEAQIPVGNTASFFNAASMLPGHLTNNIVPNQATNVEAKPLFNLGTGATASANKIILQQSAPILNPPVANNFNPMINVLGAISQAATNSTPIDTNMTLPNPNLKVKHEMYDTTNIPVTTIAPQFTPQVAHVLNQPVMITNISPQVSQPVTFLSQVPATSPPAMVTSPVSKQNIDQPSSQGSGVVLFNSVSNTGNVMQVNICPDSTTPTASLVEGNIVAARIETQKEPALKQPTGTNQNLFAAVQGSQNTNFGLGTNTPQQNVFGSMQGGSLQLNPNPVSFIAPVQPKEIGLQNVTFGTANTGLQPVSQLGSFSYPPAFKESQSTIPNQQQNTDNDVNMQNVQPITNQPTFGDLSQGINQGTQQQQITSPQNLPTFGSTEHQEVIGQGTQHQQMTSPQQNLPTLGTIKQQQQFPITGQQQISGHQNRAFPNIGAEQFSLDTKHQPGTNQNQFTLDIKQQPAANQQHSIHTESTQQFSMNDQPMQSSFNGNSQQFSSGSQQQTNFDASPQQFSTGTQHQTNYDASAHQFSTSGQPQATFDASPQQFSNANQQKTSFDSQKQPFQTSNQIQGSVETPKQQFLVESSVQSNYEVPKQQFLETNQQASFETQKPQFSSAGQPPPNYEASNSQFLVSGGQQMFNQQTQPVYSDAKSQFVIATQQTTMKQENFEVKPQFSVASQQPPVQTTDFGALKQQQFQNSTGQTPMLQLQPGFSVAGFQQNIPQATFTDATKMHFTLDTNQTSQQVLQHGFNQSKQQTLVVDQTMNIQQQPVMQQQVPQMMHIVQNLETQSMNNQAQHRQVDAKMNVDLYVAEVSEDVPMQPAAQSTIQQPTNAFISSQNSPQMANIANTMTNHSMEDLTQTQQNNQSPATQVPQQSPPQPVFHSSDQPSPIMVTDIGQNQSFHSPQQPVANIQTTNAQYTLHQVTQQPEVKMVATSMPMENFSNNHAESIQPAIVSRSQNFQTQTTVEPMATQTTNTAQMQTQNFTQQITTQQTQGMMTNQVSQQQIHQQQHVYQSPTQQIQASPQQQVPTLSPASLQIQQNDFTQYPATNSTTMQTSNTSCTGAVLHQQPQPTNADNLNPNPALEHGPNMFAMDQLLQSIDADKLASITGEDVQRQFQ